MPLTRRLIWHCRHISPPWGRHKSCVSGRNQLGQNGSWEKRWPLPLLCVTVPPALLSPRLDPSRQRSVDQRQLTTPPTADHRPLRCRPSPSSTSVRDTSEAVVAPEGTLEVSFVEADAPGGLVDLPSSVPVNSGWSRTASAAPTRPPTASACCSRLCLPGRRAKPGRDFPDDRPQFVVFDEIPTPRAAHLDREVHPQSTPAVLPVDCQPRLELHSEGLVSHP